PAKAVPTTNMTAGIRTKALKSLQVDIADFSCRAYAPGLNRVVVIHVAHRVLRSPLFTGGLDVPLLIGGAALQQHGTPIPIPGQSESTHRQREHWSLQRRFGPALAAVCRDHHLSDATGT